MIKDIIIVVLAGILVTIVLFNQPENQGRVYDCGMAEWHPDIPQVVREECRRLHYEEWKKQNGKSTT